MMPLSRLRPVPAWPPLPRTTLPWRGRASFLAHAIKATLRQHHLDLLPMFTALVPRNGIVLDVGAHAGQFAKLFARLAPEGEVLCFEPARYARSVLSLALAFNRPDNVQVYPVGLGDRNERTVLHTPVKPSGSLGFGVAHLGGDPGTGSERSELVDIVRLDDFRALFRPTRIDLIKADIEGWELRMLCGAIETIRLFRPMLWLEVVEHHLSRAGDSVAALYAFMDGEGFVPIRVDPTSGCFMPVALLLEGDVLWAPRERVL